MTTAATVTAATISAGCLLAALGTYLALAGVLSIVLVTPGYPERTARPVAAGIALFGLVIYVIGALLVAGTIGAAP